MTKTYIGAKYVPTFAEPITHSSENAYEPFTIVQDGSTFYISKRYVPAGVAVSNSAYWFEWAAGGSGTSDTYTINMVRDTTRNKIIIYDARELFDMCASFMSSGSGPSVLRIECKDQSNNVEFVYIGLGGVAQGTTGMIVSWWMQTGSDSGMTILRHLDSGSIDVINEAYSFDENDITENNTIEFDITY